MITFCSDWYFSYIGQNFAATALLIVMFFARMSARSPWRSARIAWILVLIVDAGLVVWGAMAAAWPDHLLGPGGIPILQAGYEGFSHGSWSALASTSPMTARYIEVLFRMYGVFNLAFGLMAGAIAVMAFRRGDGWWLGSDLDSCKVAKIKI